MCPSLFPSKACFCLPLTTGLNIFLWLTVILRTAGVVCGCFYGPYLYLVVSCGGLYIAADFLLLWSLYKRTEEGRFLCDFGSQKVWIILWQVFNVIGVIGLFVAFGMLLDLGLANLNHGLAMFYKPIHFTIFIIICLLIPLLMYTSCILQALYNTLKEAYIDFILSRGRDESDSEDEDLPTDVRRISV